MLQEKIDENISDLKTIMNNKANKFVLTQAFNSSWRVWFKSRAEEW